MTCVFVPRVPSVWKRPALEQLSYDSEMISVNTTTASRRNAEKTDRLRSTRNKGNSRLTLTRTELNKGISKLLLTG